MTLSFYDIIILNLKNFENKRIVILLRKKTVEVFFISFKYLSFARKILRI